jgi:hypothetical protein
MCTSTPDAARSAGDNGDAPVDGRHTQPSYVLACHFVDNIDGRPRQGQ